MSAGQSDDDLIRRGDLRDLISVDQLRDLLGVASRSGERVSRAYAINVANSKGFPDPVVAHPTADEPRIRLWLRVDVERWLDDHRPGWRDATDR